MERDHQKLMDEVYDYWNRRIEQGEEISRRECLERFGPLHRAAVLLGNLNYQVENGGFSQWWLNGYLEEDIEDLIELAEKGVQLGLESFAALKRMLTEIKELWQVVCDGRGVDDVSDDRNELFSRWIDRMNAEYDAWESRMADFQELLDRL